MPLRLIEYKYMADQRQKPASPRYEVPAAERPPEVTEQPEVRPDLPEMTTERGAASEIDTAYGGLVSKYFNEKRAVADVTESQDTEYFDYDSYLAMEQQGLEKLANPATSHELQPRDVAMPLADLAGSMSARDPEAAANATGNPEFDAKSGSEYGQAKKVFMESCARAYPGVTVNESDLGGELKRTAERLGRSADAGGAELPAKDIDELLEKDPRELARRLDGILHRTGELLQMRSRINFDNRDEQKRTEASGHLAGGVEMFYKLQLLRDSLREKMYGRKDVSRKEADEIDRMRAAFEGGAERSGTAEAAPEKEGRPEEKQALAAAEAAAGAEKAASAEAEKAGLPYAETKGPALEAMKGIWRKDQSLAGRLNSLSERARKLADLKIEANQGIDPDRALRYSLRQLYGEILPVEKKVLEEAARREADRRREKGAAGPEQTVSPERLFAELVGELAKEKRERG